MNAERAEKAGAELRRRTRQFGPRGPVYLVYLSGVAFSAVALFGFFWMNFGAPALVDPVYAGFVIILLLAARRVAGSRDVMQPGGWGSFAPALPQYWSATIVLLGIALRVVFSLHFPAQMSSDDAVYLRLTQSILAGRRYATSQGLAYWPPGLPFAFAPFAFALGAHAVLDFNIVTFTAAEWVAFALGRRLAGRSVACVAILLLAIWPNFIAAAGLLQKESLLIVLWPAAVLFYLRAGDQGGATRGAYAGLAGIATGYAILVQPASVFMPLVFAAYSLWSDGLRSKALTTIIAMWLCAGLAVLPWTIRNYIVLHQFVPVSTSGGANFYMVSRPHSDGRWDAAGDKAASELSKNEARRSSLGFRLGFANIERHPVHYMSTVLRKPLYMYGQDSNMLYWIFERGGINDPVAFSALRIVADGYYVAILFLISVYFFEYGDSQHPDPELVLPIVMLFYPILSNSLFEASERHRYGNMVIMAVFAATALLWSPPTAPDRRPA